MHMFKVRAWLAVLLGLVLLAPACGGEVTEDAGEASVATTADATDVAAAAAVLVVVAVCRHFVRCAVVHLSFSSSPQSCRRVRICRCGRDFYYV